MKISYVIGNFNLDEFLDGFRWF